MARTNPLSSAASKVQGWLHDGCDRYLTTWKNFSIARVRAGDPFITYNSANNQTVEIEKVTRFRKSVEFSFGFLKMASWILSAGILPGVAKLGEWALRKRGDESDTDRRVGNIRGRQL